MFRNLQLTDDESSVGTSLDRPVIAEANWVDDAKSLAVARQRGAEYGRTLVAARFVWRGHARVPVIALVVALAAAALVIACATLQWSQGVPTSLPTRSVVPVTSTLSHIAGYAFSTVRGAMLLQVMSDPVRVLEVVMVGSIAVQSLSVAVLWSDIDWRRLLPFLVGGIVGLPIGIWLLLNLGHVWFKEAVGGLLIAYAAYALLPHPAAIRSDASLVDACVGFLGGITGGLAGFAGASVTIWCSMRGWGTQRQRGIYQPFILIMQILALLLIQFMRSSIAPGDGPGLDPLQLVAAALLGTWFGLSIFRRLSDRRFALTANLLLLVSGVGLVV